jgi:hypothetical protein
VIYCCSRNERSWSHRLNRYICTIWEKKYLGVKGLLILVRYKLKFSHHLHVWNYVSEGIKFMMVWKKDVKNISKVILSLFLCWAKHHAMKTHCILDLCTRWSWVVTFTHRPNPHRESNPDHPIVQSVASRHTDWAITAPSLEKIQKINEITFWSHFPIYLYTTLKSTGLV